MLTAALVEKCHIVKMEDDIPQWKKDLIARLKNQTKRSEERLWTDHHHSYPRTDLVVPKNGCTKLNSNESPNSSDSEDLHYGPGIVNRLRNKYLSLALRESNVRPTILRKATSLENLLDDNDDVSNSKRDKDGRRGGGGKESGSRYRSINRRQEMKRARSVEAISRLTHDVDPVVVTSSNVNNHRQSLHEDMLSRRVEDEPLLIEHANKPPPLLDENEKSRINRPKRLPPLLNEKEKPPVDVVKHAKMIFEKRPETRTKPPPQTGEVAAKIDSFNDIFVKKRQKGGATTTKPQSKPKPVLPEKTKSNTHYSPCHHHVSPVAKSTILNEEVVKPKSLDLASPPKETKHFTLPSPIPDVSRIEKNDDGADGKSTLSDHTPDLILTSSPISQKLNSDTYRSNATEEFIVESYPEATNKYINIHKYQNKEEPDGDFTQSTTTIYNLLNAQIDQRHLPANGHQDLSTTTNGFGKIKMGLTPIEMAKNLRNSSTDVGEFQHIKLRKTSTTSSASQEDTKKTISSSSSSSAEVKKVVEVKSEPKLLVKSVVSSDTVNGKTKDEDRPIKIVLPKKTKKKDEEPASVVFNLTGRRDVPDYIANDTSRVPSKLLIPKSDEPGVTFLPDALLNIVQREAWEEDELVRSLEQRPPSPCDVTFLNDNILIDGKSSLIQRSSKRVKLKISFVDDAEIYEYPSEISLLLEESHNMQTMMAGSVQVGSTVPQVGTSLATYTPKSTADFQLGVTKSFHETIVTKQDDVDQSQYLLEEVDKPILFSSGSTSDILF